MLRSARCLGWSRRVVRLHAPLRRWWSAVTPAVPKERLDELRRVASGLVEAEEWMSAQGALEGLLQCEKPGSPHYRLALSELALCKQSLNRVKEAIVDYEASLSGDDGHSWSGAHIALLNYAELQGSQEQWAVAEGLVRQALATAEKEEPDLAIVGAARANLGTYLSMQGRHEQASKELSAAAKMLGGVLGRDSEWAVAAAANAVRAMRLANLNDDADAFAAEWKVAEEENPNEFEDTRTQIEAALEDIWRGAGPKGSLDPSGFLRDAGLKDDEALQFVDEWEKEGLPKHFIADVLENLDSPDLEEGRPAQPRVTEDKQ